MDVIKEIKLRRSIQVFSGERIDPAALERILDAGRRAPSAKNRQSWRFVVIQDEKNKQEICDFAYGEDYLRTAGAIVALCTTNVDYRMPNGQLSYPIDLAFACSFMMIQSQAEGLGSSIVTTYQEPLIRDFLTVPYSMRVVMLLAIGHPVPQELGPIKRKALDDIVSFEHW